MLNDRKRSNIQVDVRFCRGVHTKLGGWGLYCHYLDTDSTYLVTSNNNDTILAIMQQDTSLNGRRDDDRIMHVSDVQSSNDKRR